jgi:hypothetical protein
MKASATRLPQQIVRFLGRDIVWKLAFAWFGIQSAWLALTVRYPQAFDEQFHFGLIKLHATQLWPFFAHEPAGAEQYGSVVSDPSMLYHYLMSFPYRLIAVFTDSLTVQVIVLRLISVVLVVLSLYIFRKALLMLPLRKWVVNSLLAFITFLPVFPLLAAHVSYDNLALVASAGLLYLALRFQKSLSAHKPAYGLILPIVLVGSFGSLIKYAFLPIFAAVIIYFGVVLWKQRRQAIGGVWQWVRTLAIWQQAAYGLAVLAMVVLLSGSYLNNLIRYHDIIPRCDRVLTVEQCSHYAPWQRDHEFAKSRVAPTLKQDVQYVGQWYNQNIYETFFTIFSKYDDDGVTVLYYASKPVLILYIAGEIMVALSAIVLIARFKTVWRVPALRLCLLISLLYMVALFGQDVRGFLHSGYPVAIHGRYFLLILAPLMACVVYAMADLLRSAITVPRRRSYIQAGMVAVIALVFTQGGGAATYILRSHDDWYWPQSAFSQEVNRSIRHGLANITLE